MSPDNGPPAKDYWDRVEDVFVAVLAADESARPGVLDARCQSDRVLRAEVEALLSAHASAGVFITPQTVGIAAASLAHDDGPGPGARVGAFRLGERIARGGMGEVYHAERVEGEFDQQVAIKLIAARLRGADTVRRFRAERQILASLRHPNIVTLLDGGVTADGQPYIVMEYVDGLPLTEFCRRHAAALEPRLRLFQQVCVAVGFAHRHLVVHRDLKPGNVFVTTESVVKVLDFGVATLLDPHDATAGTTMWLAGPMTPNYASPEQMRGQQITTACDVYALGVMLYELLVGTRPYDTDGRTVDEILSIVTEREPGRPSAGSGTEVPYDVRDLRGDLDAIVRKAMAKDPAHRYASAEELGDDLGRVLAGQPIVAREPSLWYVGRKAIARRRGVFAVAAVALVLLIVALFGALWQARVAQRERQRAEQRFQQVRQLANYVIYDLQDGVSRLTGATELRRSMVVKSLQYLDLLAADAAGDTALLVEIAGAYRKLGDVLGNPVVANLGDHAGAVAAYAKAEAVYRAILVRHGGHADAQRALARLLLAEGDFYRILGPVPRAERAVAESRAIWQSLLQSDPGSEDSLNGLASAELSFYLQADRPRSDESSAHLYRALSIFQKLHDAKPGDEERMRNVALCHRYLVTFHLSRKADETAFDHARLAAEMDARRVARDPHNAGAQVDYAVVLSQMGVCKKRLGFREEARTYYLQSLSIRRNLWESDRANIRARDHLMYMLTETANLELSLGRWDDARTHAQEAIQHALSLQHKVAGSLPMEILIQGYSHLGRVARGLKRDPCDWFRRSLALTPATAADLDKFQYRVAVNVALQSARDGMKGCAP